MNLEEAKRVADEMQKEPSSQRNEDLNFSKCAEAAALLKRTVEEQSGEIFALKRELSQKRTWSGREA